MQKLRTIQVVNVRWLNATAWYGLFLSRLLNEQGHETLVLGLKDTASFKKAEEWGLNPIALPLNSSRPADMARVYTELRKLVRDFKPDIINCHRGEAFALFSFLRSTDKSFALVRTRGDQRHPRNNTLNRLMHTKVADSLIATNTDIADFFLDEFRADEHKLHTILGGVDTKTFYPDKSAGEEVRKKLGYSASDFVVGILGRLDPVKGHEILINALGKFRERRPHDYNIKLLCIGAPANLTVRNIERMAELSGIADCIHVTGNVENVRAYINAMDLGVLASVSSEAIARAALEIIACDIPLLSSNIGVMPDIMPPELLVQLADINALSAELEKYVFNPVELDTLRAVSQEALNGLREHDFLENTLKAYQNALEEKAAKDKA